MAFTYAGLYGTDSVTDAAGAPLPAGTPATVHVAGTATLAVLYTNRTKAFLADNPVLLIDSGMLKFWAEPGLYDITVFGYTYEADVAVAAEDVALEALPGPAGPTGPPGPAGSGGGGGSYVHDQGTASSTWTITHNLGFRPNVQVFDSAGEEAFGGTIVHVSVNQMTITWSAAFGGLAYLS